MQPMNEKLSRVIDSMRMPLIFLVVIAHLVPFTLPEINFSRNPDDIYTLISEMFSHNIAKLSVRCYFLISGFYFFNKFKDDIVTFYRTQLFKKVKSLLVPFIVWNVMLILAVFIKHHVFLKVGLGPEESYDFILGSSFFDLFWGLPINFPLWYVRDLLCMMILSPLIYLLIRYTKYFGVIGLAALYFLQVESQVPGLSTTAIFFFTLGAYFAVEKIDVLALFDKFKYPAYILTLVFLVLSLKHNGLPDQEYYLRPFIFFGVFSIINLFNLLYDTKPAWSKKLMGYSSLSFFIYAAHEIYIINWLKGGFFGLSVFSSGWGKLIAYFIIPILCMVICTVIYKILMKIIPRWFAFSLGGRLPNYYGPVTPVAESKSDKVEA